MRDTPRFQKVSGQWFRLDLRVDRLLAVLPRFCEQPVSQGVPRTCWPLGARNLVLPQAEPGYPQASGITCGGHAVDYTTCWVACGHLPRHIVLFRLGAGFSRYRRETVMTVIVRTGFRSSMDTECVLQ